MKQVICTIRDSVSNVYGRPFFAVTRGSALRGFIDEVNNPAPENLLNKHPSDFELFELGTYDDSSAEFELHPQPLSVALAKNCIVSPDTE